MFPLFAGCVAECPIKKGGFVKCKKKHEGFVRELPVEGSISLSMRHEDKVNMKGVRELPVIDLHQIMGSSHGTYRWLIGVWWACLFI